MSSRLTTSPAWQSLLNHARTIQNTKLTELFSRDAERAKHFQKDIGPLCINYSRQRVTTETLNGLRALSGQACVGEKMQAMLRGETVNNTEQRAACHNQLRSSQPPEAVHAMRKAMRQLVEEVHSKPFTHVINVGIGGSDLGPRLVVDALHGLYQSKLDCRFAANIDPTVVSRLIRECPASTTLVVVSSKSFGTEETRANAIALIDWLKKSLGEQYSAQVVAITAAPDKARELGIERSIGFPDWVGGRFSVWSAIGLPIALTYGFAAYEDFLAGGESIDQSLAEDADNAAVTAGLLDIWNRNLQNWGTLAVLPYAERLRLLPDYLQQLFMESQGKQVTREGDPSPCDTGMVLFGSQGTNGQHSFHQLLHQGSSIIPCDFLLPLHSADAVGDQHQRLIANALAQSLALAQGESAEQIKKRLRAEGIAAEEAERLAQHKAMPGNRPSTIISFGELNASTLGALIAFYEYRMLTASFVWDINPFDQWGVELGKVTSQALLKNWQAGAYNRLDPVSAQLLDKRR